MDNFTPVSWTCPLKGALRDIHFHLFIHPVSEAVSQSSNILGDIQFPVNVPLFYLLSNSSVTFIHSVDKCIRSYHMLCRRSHTVRGDGPSL